MQTILVTGGTGMIGTALTDALLAKQYRVIVLTRDNKKNTPGNPNLEYAQWDIDRQEIDKDAIASSDHIIHLAGAAIAEKRWSEKRKQEIADSRVNSGKLLVKALREIPNKVKTVVGASAIGWYGPDQQSGTNDHPSSAIRQPGPFIETDPSAPGFLGETCKKWEESLYPVIEIGKRLVQLRTGLVLSHKGGLLEPFKKSLRFGIATILGNGKQVMSWIHIDDLVALYITAIENEHLAGVYNAVAPHPVINKQFVLQLARKKNGRFFIPVRVPAFALKLALGEMSIEVLKSATVSSDKVEKTGFKYRYATIETALSEI